MHLVGTKHYPVRMFSDYMDDFVMDDSEDDPRIGRPTECRNDNNVRKISQLLLQNRHLSLRMLADEVNIGKDCS
jgi:hypothetical protein